MLAVLAMLAVLVLFLLGNVGSKRANISEMSIIDSRKCWLSQLFRIRIIGISEMLAFFDKDRFHFLRSHVFVSFTASKCVTAEANAKNIKEPTFPTCHI